MNEIALYVSLGWVLRSHQVQFMHWTDVETEAQTGEEVCLGFHKEQKGVVW